MYYGSGTYEAFARPEKPEGVDKKICLYNWYRFSRTISSILFSKRWTNER